MERAKIIKHIDYLERTRIHFNSPEYIKKTNQNTSDIYEERHILKSASFDNEYIQYIVEIILTSL